MNTLKDLVDTKNVDSERNDIDEDHEGEYVEEEEDDSDEDSSEEYDSDDDDEEEEDDDELPKKKEWVEKEEAIPKGKKHEDKDEKKQEKKLQRLWNKRKGRLKWRNMSRRKSSIREKQNNLSKVAFM